MISILAFCWEFTRPNQIVNVNQAFSIPNHQPILSIDILCKSLFRAFQRPDKWSIEFEFEFGCSIFSILEYAACIYGTRIAYCSEWFIFRMKCFMHRMGFLFCFWFTEFPSSMVQLPQTLEALSAINANRFSISSKGKNYVFNEWLKIDFGYGWPKDSKWLTSLTLIRWRKRWTRGYLWRVRISDSA